LYASRVADKALEEQDLRVKAEHLEKELADVNEKLKNQSTPNS
jgi:hypothetical protein